jgi:uncharacterized membrane protein
LLVYNSPEITLIFEATWVSLGSFFLFKITREETLSLSWSFTFQAIYILFSSNYAIVTNGPEFELLLPTFVLISYYFFRKGKYVTALTIGFLGATTSIVSPAIIGLFFIIEDYGVKGYAYRFLHPVLMIRNREKMTVSSTYKHAFLFFWGAMIILVTLIFMTTPIHDLIPNFPSNVPITAGTSYSSGILASFWIKLLSSEDIKLTYLYQTLVGFLFLPLISPYALEIAPFFLFVFYANFTELYYVLNHYTSLISGFLFLGLVYNIKTIKFNNNKLRKLMIALIIAMFISFLLYSPFNVTNLENGTIHSEFIVTPEDHYLDVAFSLIPQNASVFSQNAFPQLTNRISFYMPGSYNNQTVDYSVISPISPASFLPNFLGFSSFWAQHFLNNSSYGIFEFVGGVTVLKLNYHSSPVLFIPLVLNYSINANLAQGTKPTGYAYNGQYDYLPPGEYRITYLLQAQTNESALSSIGIDETTLMSNGTAIPASAIPISGLIEKNGFFEYTIVQSFYSYLVEYSLNLIISAKSGILPLDIKIVSVQIETINVEK